MEKGEPEKRAVVTIRTRPEAVDQFHNSSSGYRAQFYVSPALGESANRTAVEALSERVLASPSVYPLSEATHEHPGTALPRRGYALLASRKCSR
jgi:hypothetical protein